MYLDHICFAIGFNTFKPNDEDGGEFDFNIRFGDGSLPDTGGSQILAAG